MPSPDTNQYRSGMSFRSAATAAIVVMVVAGCNGDDDSTDTTSVTSAETTTSEATEPTASTDAPVTTTEPTSTSTTPPTVPTTTGTPTSTTDTTNPGTSSPDDFATQAIEVIERAEASWNSVLVAFGEPFNDDKVAALSDFFTGVQLEGFNNLIGQFREGNFRLVPRTDMQDTYEAEPRSLTLSLEDGFATVQVCHIETSITVETGGNPDGTDRVAADEIEQQIVELDLVRIDGVWKIENARAPETEIAQCP